MQSELHRFLLSPLLQLPIIDMEHWENAVFYLSNPMALSKSSPFIFHFQEVLHLAMLDSADLVFDNDRLVFLNDEVSSSYKDTSLKLLVFLASRFER